MNYLSVLYSFIMATCILFFTAGIILSIICAFVGNNNNDDTDTSEEKRKER